MPSNPPDAPAVKCDCDGLWNDSTIRMTEESRKAYSRTGHLPNCLYSRPDAPDTGELAEPERRKVLADVRLLMTTSDMSLRLDTLTETVMRLPLHAQSGAEYEKAMAALRARIRTLMGNPRPDNPDVARDMASLIPSRSDSGELEQALDELETWVERRQLSELRGELSLITGAKAKAAAARQSVRALFERLLGSRE